ncbi:hypothetical protein [Arcticibacter sp. MXS-1]|uniref:AbrB/MazE/SpoVT family DNA-binding domain-containing protein n=1 Tax=Arcticibacter sp. MXS-1 TaxID=3341726 RepID=UPI0035A831FF
MVVRVRKIGNSTGILLSKSMIEQCQIKDEVDIEVKNDSIVIKAVKKKPRHDWEEQFQAAHSAADKESLMGDFNNQFDEDEWTW